VVRGGLRDRSGPCRENALTHVAPPAAIGGGVAACGAMALRAVQRRGVPAWREHHGLFEAWVPVRGEFCGEPLAFPLAVPSSSIINCSPLNTFHGSSCLLTMQGLERDHASLPCRLGRGRGSGCHAWLHSVPLQPGSRCGYVPPEPEKSYNKPTCPECLRLRGCAGAPPPRRRQQRRAVTRVQVQTQEALCGAPRERARGRTPRCARGAALPGARRPALILLHGLLCECAARAHSRRSRSGVQPACTAELPTGPRRQGGQGQHEPCAERSSGVTSSARPTTVPCP